MLKELTATGRSVEEAIEQGAALLGYSSGDVRFDIIDLPKKGFLGLVNTPAKVRVYVELPDAPVPPAPVPAAPKQNRTSEKTSERVSPARSAAQETAAAPVAAGALPADDRALKKAEAAEDYLRSIFTAMGLDAAGISSRTDSESAVITLTGDGLGVIIGRRGETLDALQYLTSLVANRLGGDYLRITIDSGDYREKRKKTLEQLARKMAGNAVRTGKSVTLEPMNPYERRIIHAAVAGVKGASSASVGEEPARRIVINPTSSKRNGYDNRSGDRRGGKDFSRRPRADKPAPYVPTPKPDREKPSEATRVADKPLYGKIEL